MDTRGSLQNISIVRILKLCRLRKEKQNVTWGSLRPVIRQSPRDVHANGIGKLNKYMVAYGKLTVFM